jgi:hypothetical protein
MTVVQLDLEDEIAALLRQSNRPVSQTAREFIVLELYRRGGISSGKAGELLGFARMDFIRYASQLGIPYFS